MTCLPDLPQLWRQREGVARRIAQSTTRVPAKLAAEYAALTTAIADGPADDDGIDVKLALLRELAEHAPDREVMIRTLDTLEAAVQNRCQPARARPVNIIRCPENKGYIPLPKYP
ncbi:hypothetical protein [Azospirillum argentinense]|uniref:Uncharacterized protein n=1 Tax=Azospirillum brasilense TaxID=192 RepID=A0A4D8QH36_AZOBR|nr:hypothetical protein [Azospirillum argentinense]QCO07560.1 hypothetical protein D3867_37385 [Azospirillum argentinense]